MKAYVITTGALFGLLAIIHGWRVVIERPPGHEGPVFIGITVLTAVLCLWAVRLLWRWPGT